MICENCGHEIKKVTFIRNEQSMKEYRHKNGGNYCKRTIYGKNLPFGKVCFCSNAKPKEKGESK